MKRNLETNVKYDNKFITKEVIFQEGLREIVALKKIHSVKTDNIINIFFNTISYDFITNKISYRMKKYEHLPSILNSEERKRLLYDILKALVRLEELGIEHRDIVPHNILYDRSENKYILIDFGSAVFNSFDSLTYNSGTSPPEYLKDSNYPDVKPTFDGKSDIFALAYTFLLLKGVKAPSSRLSIYNKHWKKWADEDMIEFLTPMLEYDPANRSTAHQLLNLNLFKTEDNIQTIEMNKYDNIIFKLLKVEIEKQVHTYAKNIFKMIKLNDYEMFSFYLGCLEIAGALYGNESYYTSYFDVLHHTINIEFNSIRSEILTILDRKFVICEIITNYLKYL